MTGLSLRNYRKALGLSQTQLGSLLGYQGKRLRQQISRMENRKASIPAAVERVVNANMDGYRPSDWPVKS